MDAYDVILVRMREWAVGVGNGSVTSYLSNSIDDMSESQNISFVGNFFFKMF